MTTPAHTSSPRHLSARGCARAFLAWLPGGKGVKITIVTLVAAALVAGLLAVMALPSRADQTTFTVTSALLGNNTSSSGNGAANNDADTNAGDGSCIAYSGGCTLKAAIQEANAEYSANSNAGPFLIDFDPSIQGTTANPTVIQFGTTNTGWMSPATSPWLSGQESGAVYKITAPTTVDLTGMQLGSPGLSSDIDKLHGAWFNIAGPNITIQNFWAGVYGPEGSIVVTSTATNATVQNGIWTPSNSYAERFMTIQAGVKGVAANNLQLSGGDPGDNDENDMGGYFSFTKTGGGSNFSNIVLGPNIQITQAASGGTCNTSTNTGGGCFNSILAWDSDSDWDDENYGSASGNGKDAVPSSNPSWAFNGFSFSGNYVSGLPSKGTGLCFASGDGGYYTVGASSNFVIEKNIFDNIIGDRSPAGGCNRTPNTFGAGLIVLPRFLSGTNSISGNIFRSVASGSSNLNDAILYFGNAKTVNNTKASALTIKNNYFDGWSGGAGIQLVDAGLVTVEGNTFGSNNSTQSSNAGVPEEYSYGTSGTMTTNYPTGSGTSYATGKQTTNQSVRTWAPTAAATVLSGSAPTSNVTLTGTPSSLASMSTCPVSLNVSQVTDAPSSSNNNTQPTMGLPVNVGVYWTGARTADVFLGYAQVTSGTSATLTVPLPVGQIAMPVTGTTQIVGSSDLAAPPVFSAGSATIVDPVTGTVQTGYLRLQTQVAAGGSQALSQNESSQYSRWVTVSGSCGPGLTVSQNATFDGRPEDGSPQGADAQAYDTMNRVRVFTVTASTPLDPDSFTTDSVALSGTAPGAQVVSVTPVTGSNNTQFTVVTQANDSGIITLTVPTGSVATPSGLKNIAPSSGSAATISGTPQGTLGDTLSYTNPLTVTPTTFAIVAGDSKGQWYSFSTKPGAPVPSDAVNFAVSETPGDPYPLDISTTSPSIAAGGNAVGVRVVAPKGTVPAGGVQDTLTHEVDSGDPNYDGLIVPSVTVGVYSTDPYITIQKEAFIGVTGGASGNSPANIQSTGTQVASGSNLTEWENVWFMFHVCNISAQTGPAWVTDLTNVQVTDDVLGNIGTIASLPAGTASSPGCKDLVYASNPVAIEPTQ